MATLVYLDATGLTVTCTVSLNGGTTGAPTVSESSGVYTATYTNAGAGLLYVMWDNATTKYREIYYWDGTNQLLAPAVTVLTQQNIRDAMKLAHTDGNPSLDTMLANIEGEVL